MRIPKYRKHSSRDTGFVEHQGVRIYFAGRYNSAESQAAYRAFLRTHSLAEPTNAPGEVVTVGMLVSRYLDYAIDHYPADRNSGYANVRLAVLSLLKDYALLPVQEFGPLKLKALRAKWEEMTYTRGKQKTGKPLSRKYINAKVNRVRRMFRWGVGEELVPPSVYHALAAVTGLQKTRTKAPEPSPIKSVKWEHVEPVLAELNPVVRAMVLLHWHTGARSDSICNAHVSQFDRSVSPWIWKPKHKTEHLEHQLVVFVGPQAQSAILPFLDNTGYLFCPRLRRRNRRYRGHYDSGSYRQSVQRAITRANTKRAQANEPLIPRWFPHQIRHSRGTIIRSRFGIEGAQVSLGHQHADITQVYTDRDLDLARRIAAELG